MVHPDDERAIPLEGTMDRLLAVFTRPAELFASLDQRPAWVLPLVVVIVVTLVHVAVTAPFTGSEYLKELESKEDIPQEHLERIRVHFEPSRMVRRGMIGAVILMIIGLLFSAGVTHGVCLLSGGDAVFMKTLSIFSYTLLVHVPGLIIRTVLMWIKQSSHVYTSLALLWPSGDMSSPLFRFLSAIDGFTVWRLVLISGGLATVFRFRRTKASGIVFGLWAVAVLLWIVLGTFTGPMFGR